MEKGPSNLYDSKGLLYDLCRTFVTVLFGLHNLTMYVSLRRGLKLITPEENRSKVLQTYGKLPLAFVQNVGQDHERIHYYAKGSKYGIYFMSEEVVFWNGIALRFLGANREVIPEGRQQGTGRVHYLKGNDPSTWHRNLATYEEVVYTELWPGVDALFRGNNGQLKYEFVVKPGANYEDIQFAYHGVDSITLDDRGNMMITTADGVLTDERPYSYQEKEGQRVEVESAFLIKQGENGLFSVGFELGHEYDPQIALVIDPGLVYSTLLGGSMDDFGSSIVVDVAGNAYVSGATFSDDFPTTEGVVGETTLGNGDVFVTKINADGSGLVYSTYLGGVWARYWVESR